MLTKRGQDWMQSALPTVSVAAAFFLFAAQLFISFHEAEFGCEEHSHEGVECELTLFADRFDGLDLPSVAETGFVPTRIDTAPPHSVQTITTARQWAVNARAPPMRSS